MGRTAGWMAAAALLLAGPAFAQHSHGGDTDGPPEDPGHATDMAFTAFAQGCAPRLGHAETIRLAMGDVGLKAAPEVVSAQLPHGADDLVWVLPHPGVGVAAVWSPDGAACRIHVQRADLDRLKAIFVTLMQNTGSNPGVAVQRRPDVAADGRETVSFTVTGDVKSPLPGKRLYSLTLDKGGKVQAVLGAELIAPAA